MRRTRDRRWALKSAAILLMPLLLGATYKWVDPQGQVHFTDSPPPAGTAYEIIAPPHSPAVSPTAPSATQPAPAAPEAVPAAAAESPPREVADTAGASRDAMRCVDALFQLEVLAGDWKVYKPGPGNDRTYLNDRDRPAEIARLSSERDANCSDEAEVLCVAEAACERIVRGAEPGLQGGARETAEPAATDCPQCPVGYREAEGLHCGSLPRRQPRRRLAGGLDLGAASLTGWLPPASRWLSWIGP